jgi:hypothetical protein
MMGGRVNATSTRLVAGCFEYGAMRPATRQPCMDTKGGVGRYLSPGRMIPDKPGVALIECVGAGWAFLCRGHRT